MRLDCLKEMSNLTELTRSSADSSVGINVGITDIADRVCIFSTAISLIFLL